MDFPKKDLWMLLLVDQGGTQLIEYGFPSSQTISTSTLNLNVMLCPHNLFPP